MDRVFEIVLCWHWRPKISARNLLFSNFIISFSKWNLLDHGHFENPTFEKTCSIMTWHIRINKVRYIGKKGPLVCIIATRFHVTQSIYFRIYIQLKIVKVLQIEWNFVYKKAESKLSIFVFLILISLFIFLKKLFHFCLDK